MFESQVRSRHIYARLIQAGWLEESRYGLRVTVDMPAGAMHRFCDQLVPDDSSSSIRSPFGGREPEVDNIIFAEENQQGLERRRALPVNHGRGLHPFPRAVGRGNFVQVGGWLEIMELNGPLFAIPSAHALENLAPLIKKD